MTLEAKEFLRRFVQHVLPKRFIKMRHYGLLANRCRQQRLDRCRRLLFVATVTALLACGSANTVMEPASKPSCPRCGGTRFVRFDLPDTAGMPAVGDTS
jgi:hypothetical protein